MKTSDKKADVEMRISDFSSFIIGCHDAADIAWNDKIKVNGNMENIEKVFYKKPIFITEYF